MRTISRTCLGLACAFVATMPYIDAEMWAEWWILIFGSLALAAIFSGFDERS